MILTSRGKFAVLALIDIDLYSNNAPIKLLSVAERQNIDFGYLEQIFIKLKKANLVKSTKGPGGGYMLARNSAEITISEVLEAVEEDMKLTRCSKREGEGCMTNKSRCRTHHLWENVEKKINAILTNITLHDVIINHNKEEAA